MALEQTKSQQIEVKKLNDALLKFREKAGFSQQYVAEKCEISQQAYSYIENGKRKPSVKVAKKIAEILNFPWEKFYEDTA